MHRKSFLALSAAAVAAMQAAPARAMAAGSVRTATVVHADRTWLIGRPGRCAAALGRARTRGAAARAAAHAGFTVADFD